MNRMSDAISRQMATNVITKRLFETAFNNVGIKQDIDETLVDVAENRLENWFNELPPIQPERKTGHWVEIGDEPYDEWECDVCGFVIDGSGCIDPEEYIDVYRFCPNCGKENTTKFCTDCGNARPE